MAEISDALAHRLLALFEGRLTTDAALTAILDAEESRRGAPDRVSGAYNWLALMQGSLLKREYDLSTHGHHEGWEIGAAIVDIQALIRVNQDHGFPAGDAVLRAVTGSLNDAFPSAKIVRIHSDAFAVLLPPSAERIIDAGTEGEIREALTRGVPEKLAAAGFPRDIALGYTVALLHLTIERPSHWQVLGPLVWAEAERALVLVKAGAVTGVQRRRVPLEAAVPITTMG